jgi:hypothetical protein
VLENNKIWVRIFTQYSVSTKMGEVCASGGGGFRCTIRQSLFYQRMFLMRNSKVYAQEDRVVAELAQLGVGYLSRQGTGEPPRTSSPDILIADLIRQPTSRVRVAVISLFLAHPEYAQYVPAALKSLPGRHAQILKIFYSAAFLLQKQYARSLRPFLGGTWKWLPDLFSQELGLADVSPKEQLKKLAQTQTELMKAELNWAGTYNSAAHQLLRRCQMEKEWNQSPP